MYFEHYADAREYAQKEADRDGYDWGIEQTPHYMPARERWRVFGLPGRESRYGHETRCEVVSCSVLERCRKGHGPIR